MAMYVYPSGVETPIKNMYIGEYVEETFTVSKGNTIDIAKSGFKIKQIKTNYTSSASANNQYMSSRIQVRDENWNYYLSIPYTYLSVNITSNNKFLNLYCTYNWTTTVEYTSPWLSPVTWPFNIEFIATSYNAKCVCNGNTILDQTATTNWRQIAEHLFWLSRVDVQYVIWWTSSYYTWSNDATIIVLYEKV